MTHGRAADASRARRAADLSAGRSWSRRCRKSPASSTARRCSAPTTDGVWRSWLPSSAQADRLALEERYVDAVRPRTHDVAASFRARARRIARSRAGNGRSAADLREGRARAGAGTSCPTTCPAVLEYLSCRPLAEAREMLGDCAHILRKVGERTGAARQPLCGGAGGSARRRRRTWPRLEQGGRAAAAGAADRRRMGRHAGVCGPPAAAAASPAVIRFMPRRPEAADADSRKGTTP